MSTPEKVITGFRPTSDLTVGNYLGAIKPAIDLQNQPGTDLYVFVADIHGLTDHDPRDLAPYRSEVVRDCMALGIDPQRSTVYMQSDIEAPTTQIANRAAPYISVSELARTPNLKEKMQTAVRKGESESAESLLANFGLLGYPVLMAADIYAQDARKVAVGEDQEPHLELARTIARRFNARFDSSVLVEPRIVAIESLRILSLDGKGKMSKTNAPQALLLTDDPDAARRKIKKATTAEAGVWNDAIASHFMVAEATVKKDAWADELAQLKRAHMAGKAVMGDFKNLWGSITEDMLVDFQTRKALIHEDDVQSALRYGADKAGRNANAVLDRIKGTMGF